jgi:hypothetical protein
VIKSTLGSVAFALALSVAPLSVCAQTTSPAPVATPAPTMQSQDNTWHTTISPYLWLPGIGGTLSLKHPALTEAGDANVNINTGPSNYLSFINGGGLIAANVSKGAFDVGADLMFLNLSHNGNSAVTITGPLGELQIPVTSAVGWHLNATLWELTPGMTLAHGSGGDVGAFIGVRSLSLTAAANWTFTGPIDLVPLTGQAGGNATLTDFIGGVRGKLALGDKWYVPYYVDFGGGNANSTYQWYTGIAYAQHWGDLTLFYRDLGYNQTNSDARLQNVNLAGLGFGATFKL